MVATRHFPGQLDDVVRSLADTVEGVYEHDILPLFDILLGDGPALRTVLLSLCQAKDTGMLPCELRFAASLGDGTPLDDANLLSVLDVIAPYALAPGREDGLVCLSCGRMRAAVVKKFRGGAASGADRERQREGYNAVMTHR